MACVGHGVRNGGIPQFECVIYVPTLLIASTAALTIDRGQIADELRALLERMGGDAVLIRSVEDFGANYPDLADLVGWIDGVLERDHDGAGPPGRYFYRLGDEQRRLLALAIVILLRLEVDPALLPPAVRQIYEAWR
jgi:hypothetical protein